MNGGRLSRHVFNHVRQDFQGARVLHTDERVSNLCDHLGDFVNGVIHFFLLIQHYLVQMQSIVWLCRSTKSDGNLVSAACAQNGLILEFHSCFLTM